jgi:CelD/BcsL family acetyltransferase involved in cellulose biosynthesis
MLAMRVSGASFMVVETGTIWDNEAARAPVAAGLFETEVVDGKTLLASAGTGYAAAYHAAAWKSLAARAAEPNPFFDPAFITAAAAAMRDPRRLVMVLVWRGSGRTPDDLVGLAAFRVSRTATHLWLPVLEALAHDYAFLATPAVGGSEVEPILAAMLDAVAAMPALPKVIFLPHMGDGGPVMAGLRAVADRRRSPIEVIATRQRALLRPSQAEAGRSASGWAPSSSTRKKWRQHRRRLAELGPLATTRHRTAIEVAEVLEEFLKLEASGWKGRNGTAVAGEPARADFVRSAFRDMAGAGHVDIAALRLDGRAIAIQVMLRAGAGVFTWKIAYDEALGDYSPGTLLVEDYTNDLVADPAVALLDSCSHDDSGFMATLWKDRQVIVDVLVSAGPGRHLGVTLLGAFERRLRAVRELAKTLYHRFKKRR